MFEQSMCHTASPTHCVSPVADHSTRPIPPRHRKPPCCHPSTTHPAGGGAPSQGLDGTGRSAGPRASGHPRIRAEFGDSSGGQRLLLRGEGFSFELWRCFGRFAWRGCQGGKLMEVEEVVEQRRLPERRSHWSWQECCQDSKDDVFQCFLCIGVF